MRSMICQWRQFDTAAGLKEQHDSRSGGIYFLLVAFGYIMIKQAFRNQLVNAFNVVNGKVFGGQNSALPGAVNIRRVDGYIDHLQE